jgi:hypothetical protein
MKYSTETARENSPDEIGDLIAHLVRRLADADICAFLVPSGMFNDEEQNPLGTLVVQ